MTHSDSILDTNLFKEPDNLYVAEPTQTYISYLRTQSHDNEPDEMTLRLVGKSPLWGHLLWNAGRVSAEYVETSREELVGKKVLELGAAAALPSLLASLVAKNVVATDFPDPDLIENIQYNIDLLEKHTGRKLPICSLGYRWGDDVEPLLNAMGQNGEKFDLIILSDLLFNHKEHGSLLRSCQNLLKRDGVVIVVFTPHRPHLFQKDLEFFELARNGGFEVEKFIEKRMTPMFEEDEDTKELRSMVYGYRLRFQS